MHFLLLFNNMINGAREYYSDCDDHSKFHCSRQRNLWKTFSFSLQSPSVNDSIKKNMNCSHRFVRALFSTRHWYFATLFQSNRKMLDFQFAFVRIPANRRWVVTQTNERPTHSPIRFHFASIAVVTLQTSITVLASSIQFAQVCFGLFFHS